MGLRDQVESELPVRTDAAGSSRRFEDHGVPGMHDAHHIANEVLFQIIQSASGRKAFHFEMSDEFGP